GPDVTAYETRDPGALHLDHHLLAARQARGVHLRDRRGGDRLLVEPGEGALERRTEIFLDDPPDEPEGLRRDLVAAPLELVDQLGREEALARRHDLAELDVRGAQPLEGATQPARQAGARRRTARATFVELPAGERGPEERRGLREPAQRRQETTAHQLGHLRLGAGPSRLGAGTPHQMLGIDGPRATLAEGAEREIGRGARRHLARPTGHGVAPQTSADRSGPAAAGSLPPRVLAETPWTTGRTRSSRGCERRTSASSGRRAVASRSR